MLHKVKFHLFDIAAGRPRSGLPLLKQVSVEGPEVDHKNATGDYSSAKEVVKKLAASHFPNHKVFSISHVVGGGFSVILMPSGSK